MDINQRTTGATIILFCLIAFWVFSVIRKRRQDERKKRILQEGVEANATVMHIAPTGEYLNNLPEFQVKVKVKPLAGEIFETEMREVFPYAKYDSIRSGSSVTIKYHPEFYKRAIFVNVMESVN